MYKFEVKYKLYDKISRKMEHEASEVIYADSESAAKILMRKQLYLMPGHVLKTHRAEITSATLLS